MYAHAAPYHIINMAPHPNNISVNSPRVLLPHHRCGRHVEPLDRFQRPIICASMTPGLPYHISKGHGAFPPPQTPPPAFLFAHPPPGHLKLPSREQRHNLHQAKTIPDVSLMKNQPFKPNEDNVNVIHKRTAVLIPKLQVEEYPGNDALERKSLKRHHDVASINPANLSPNNSPVCQAKRRLVTDNSVSPNHDEKFPKQLKSENEKDVNKTWDKVSRNIYQFYKESAQTEKLFESKIQLRDCLVRFLQELFPSCGLFIVGSSLTGFGCNTSDLDLCMMISDQEVNQKVEGVRILKMVHNCLNKLNFVLGLTLIRARVPIIKFVDSINCIKVDLNVNNAVGIRNTQLLNCYGKCDQRLRPLSVVIKMWAKQHDINDASLETLSSYSLILMLIHFMQCCEPPILPCLQRLLPNKFQPDSDVRQLVLHEEIPPFNSRNKKDLGELLLEFFDYFGNKFNYETDVISVRTGGTLSRDLAMNGASPKNRKGHWKFICIEEPFERTNTASAVYNPLAFDFIQEVFRRSYKLLERTKDLRSVVDLNTTAL